MHIVPIYAAILALIFVALSVQTLRLRRKLKIAIGDAGNEAMLRAMRVHANFAEYVPLCLLLLMLAEMQGAHHYLLHILCFCLLIGRLSHAFGVNQALEKYKYRVFGMVMTLNVLVISAIYLLFTATRISG